MAKEEEAATAERTKEGFELPNKKVRLTPIKRPRRGLPADHENNLLYGESYISFSVPIRRDRNKYVNPLTPEEKDFFEDKSRSGLSFEPGDLDPNKKENNFWREFSVKLTKYPRILDLSDPMDYLEYKVLKLQNDIIAPSGEEKWDKPTYKFAIEDLDFEEKNRSKRADAKTEAYMEFGAIKDSPDKLKEVLRVAGKKPAKNAKQEFLKSQVHEIIEDDPDRFLDIIEDKSFSTKLLIQEALEAGALDKKGSRYFLRGEEEGEIGRNLKEAIEFLEDRANSDVYRDLKAEVQRFHGGSINDDEEDNKESKSSSGSNSKGSGPKGSSSKKN